MVPKLESGLFRIKIRTKRYSEVLISNSAIVYLSSIPKIPFLATFGPKFQSALFKMKLGAKEY